MISTIHCFTAGYNELITYLTAGFYVGITGWICDPRRSKNLVKALEQIMGDENLRLTLLSRLMIETDAPFLSPVREIRTNRPGLLPHVLTKLASVLGLSEEMMK